MTVPAPAGDVLGPSERVEACRSGGAILAATLELLAAHGFAGLTVDAVAARAGVGKATIYRHWRSKAELVLDAVTLAARPLVVPDTGSVRGDLLAVVATVLDVLTGSPQSRILPALVDAAERDPELADLHHRFSAARRAPLRQVLVRAVGRGELDPSIDVDLAADLLVAPLFYRRLVSHDRLDAAYAAGVVDVALRALAPRPPPPGH